MRILNLIIKQQYFNEILKGLKNEETRILKLSNYKKYLVVENEHSNIQIKGYDAIKLFVGYQANRSYLLIRIDSAYLNLRTEKVLSALANGVNVNIVYRLGNILESHL
jgi:outer membrane protein assembly factor BamA